ncbi:hypothetical protein ACIHCV_45360 [Streptomyces sp. NPDC051956]|uniref:hypothetical protein n=1 Tax=Streptomyces sp. NPDC051956 TaxID=3365677 RepID=UPI0037D65A18
MANRSRTPESGDTGQGTPESGDTGQGEGRRRRELWLSLPGLVVTTVLVGIVSWGVTRLTDGAEKLTQDDATLATVSVETNPARVGAFDDTSVYGVLPNGATPTTGPGDGCTGFHDWLLKNGGTDARESRLQVTVQGNAQRQVQITNLRVVVVSREEPAPHVGVGCPSAGSANLRFVTIDLDSPRPRAEYDSEDGAPFGFTVKHGEIETFLISATAKEAVYNWHLELDLISGKEQVHMRVDDDGKNFQTAPEARAPGWDWDWKSKWVHAESGRQRAVGDPLVPPGQAGEDTP